VPNIQDIMSDKMNLYTFWNGKEMITRLIFGAKALFSLSQDARIEVIIKMFDDSMFAALAKSDAHREVLIRSIANSELAYKDFVVYGMLLRMFRKDSLDSYVFDAVANLQKRQNFMDRVAIPGLVANIGVYAMYYYGQLHSPWVQSHPRLSSAIHLGVAGISVIAAMVFYKRDIVKPKIDAKIMDILANYVFKGVLHPMAVDFRILAGEDIEKYAMWVADNLLNVSDEVAIERMLEYKKGKLSEIQLRFIVRSINDQRMPKVKSNDDDKGGGQGSSSGGGVKPHTGGIEIDSANLDLRVWGKDIQFKTGDISSEKIDFQNIVLNIVDIRRVSSVKKLLTPG
jgi:hypothetical protein